MPKNAEYNKKTNSFELVQGNRLKIWFEDGSLYSDCEVNSLGLKHGECTVYSKKHNILSKGKYKNAQKDGIWFWYFPNGNIYVKQAFTSGKKRSYWIEASEFGNEDGEYYRYYPNGNLEEQGFYDGGYKTNDWKKYYINGQLEYVGSYNKDKKIGKWFFYYPDGTTEAKEDYDNSGELIQRITFSPTGNVICRIKKDIVNCK